ncbi:MAG: protein phosphatase CheZ [Alphaproteobacteria bacterium]|nr:protein phosphatase CheZ [Alphaproteobacteria bacterium]MDD9919323.1 protein phosphatase CheZ [Alphaproteobacteria bacterium]
MTDSTVQLESQIAAIEATEGDTVPTAQVKELVASVKGMFGDHFNAKQGLNGEDKALYHELGELARFINSAKKELQEVSSSQLTNKEIPDASSQLDAIVHLTEQATGKIMDECERVQSIHQMVRDRLLAAEPPLDPDAMAGVDDAMTDAETSVTHIYEACNFQDITGQRIQKVVKALQEIERQVLRMVVVFGLSHNDELDEETKKELEHDVELLSGPALSGQGLDQGDIDDILETLL